MPRTSPARSFAAATASLLLAAALAGCPQVSATKDSGVDPGQDAGCAGLPGCECAQGACSVGECIGGTCVDCRRGEAACSCRANQTCNAGLRCNTTGLCETCPAGSMGCACGTGDTCGTGLVCSNGTCVTDTCVPGAAACPCRASDPKCDGNAYCDPMTVCQACSNDVVGCPCDSSQLCAGSTVCDTASGRCRAVVTCADLLSSGSCLPNQACTQPNGADALCTPMTCLPQFKWNGTACIACASQDCLNEPSCADLDGGFGATCASQNRTCVQTGMVAACGVCLPGYAGAATGPCIPMPSCGAATCTINQYCDKNGATPTCRALPCPPGQTTDGSGTSCVASTRTCSGPGLSGRLWPFRTLTDTEVCETLDGYFTLAAGGAPVRCDADGDGWVREEADATAIRSDPALYDNSRCAITAVTRVRLYDEYGIWVDVLSCSGGLKKASLANPDGGVPNGGLGLLADGGLVPSDVAACPSLVPLRLLETLATDVPGSARGNSAPPYGGRLLESNELNALTKACVSSAADFNDNKAEDIKEIQGTVAATRPATDPDRLLLEQFAYFIELHSAAVENGILVIRERSRCDPAFPLRYDPNVALDGGVPIPSDLYTTATDNPYWRTCSRNRDPNFNTPTPSPGFDFAQWNCNEAQGGCPTLAPPPHPSLVGPTDPALKLMRDHGLCRLGGVPPADGLWRGMNHHSQFKCVNVLPGPPRSSPTDQLLTDFGTGLGLLSFNRCSARTCASPGDPSCSRPQGAGAQTRQPVLDCVVDTAPSTVGFAAVNYRPYRRTPPPGSTSAYNGLPTSYQGGCVNEDDDAWLPFICPYPDFNSIKDNADARFGRYSCYKYQPNFLWGGFLPDGGSNIGDRSNLYWAPDTRSSVFSPRPPPDGGL